MHHIDIKLFDYVTKGDHSNRRYDREKHNFILKSCFPMNSTDTPAKIGEIAQTLGISTEAARQNMMRICNIVNKNSELREELEKLIYELNELTPVSLSYANQYFKSKGYIANDSILSLYNIYSKLDKLLKLSYVNQVGCFESPSNEDMVSCIQSWALRRGTHNGTVSLTEVESRFKLITTDRSRLKSILMAMSNIRTLSNDHYYFVDTIPNRMLNKLKKIFSFYEDLPKDVLSEALLRSIENENLVEKKAAFENRKIKTMDDDFEYYAVVPPIDIVIELAEINGIAKEENGHVKSCMADTYKQTDIDVFMINHLKLKNGTSSVSHIRENLLSERPDMKHSLSKFLLKSPLVIKKKRGQYSILSMNTSV